MKLSLLEICSMFQLEALLRERVSSGYFELKRKFKDNDPEGKGNVSR